MGSAGTGCKVTNTTTLADPGPIQAEERDAAQQPHVTSSEEEEEEAAAEAPCFVQKNLDRNVNEEDDYMGQRKSNVTSGRDANLKISSLV